MVLNRYVVKDGFEVSVNSAIYRAVEEGSINFETRTTSEGDRLDLISFEVYKTAEYWWVIAAASGIGWWLQVPGGVEIKIPLSIDQIEDVIGKV